MRDKTKQTSYKAAEYISYIVRHHQSIQTWQWQCSNVQFCMLLCVHSYSGMARIHKCNRQKYIIRFSEKETVILSCSYCNTHFLVKTVYQLWNLQFTRHTSLVNVYCSIKFPKIWTADTSYTITYTYDNYKQTPFMTHMPKIRRQHDISLKTISVKVYNNFNTITSFTKYPIFPILSLLTSY